MCVRVLITWRKSTTLGCCSRLTAPHPQRPIDPDRRHPHPRTRRVRGRVPLIRATQQQSKILLLSCSSSCSRCSRMRSALIAISFLICGASFARSTISLSRTCGAPDTLCSRHVQSHTILNRSTGNARRTLMATVSSLSTCCPYFTLAKVPCAP